MSVMTYCQQEFPNRYKFASLIISISGPNPLVECTFSFLTNIWSDKHLPIHHNTISKSLIVYANDDLRSREEQKAIIRWAVQIYMESKGQIKNGPSTMKKWNLIKKTPLFHCLITIAILMIGQKITWILRVILLPK